MEDRQCRSPTLLQVKEREGERERAKTRFRWVFFQQSIGRDLYRFQLKPSRNEEGIKSSGMDRNAIVRVEQMELMWFCTWNFPDIIV